MEMGEWIIQDGQSSNKKWLHFSFIIITTSIKIACGHCQSSVQTTNPNSKFQMRGQILRALISHEGKREGGAG